MPSAHDPFKAGFSLEQEGNRAAKESLERARSLQPDDPQAHHDLGSVLHRLGRLHEAGRAFSRAVELNPIYAAAHLNLGLVRHDQGEWSQALASFDRALSLGLDDVDLWAARGNCLTALGSRSEALAAYDRAARLRPNADGVPFFRGDLFPLTGKAA